MRRYAHTTSLLLLICVIFHLVVSEIPSDQRNTMINLYNLLQNNTSQPPLPWNINRDPCSWKGVTCNSDNSSITRFSIQSFSLSNLDFLPVLCQINSLESIDLSDNHLSYIPSGFMTGCGNFRGLKELNFSRNRLSGSLPNFDGFLKLESLDLSHNSLSETISLQMDGLVSLKILNLGNNQFSGFVPTHLGKSMILERLGLNSNHFVGKIPEEIANYSNLTSIYLSSNDLSGSIPDRFRELLNLQVLFLSSNSLSGGIPQFLSCIKTLRRFAANQNSFSGVIPTGITTFLRNIDLSYNQLNGSIPSDLLSEPNLRTVDLSDNSLEGSVPENISSSLVRLRLGNNRLNGTIPSSSFGSLQNLTYLELDNNSLGGPIPPELGFCNSLALLNLAMNQLTGLLPVELGNLSHLQELKLQANNLDGVIPEALSQLTRLEVLDISNNSFTGRIPDSLVFMGNLTKLVLSNNLLSRSIPHFPPRVSVDTAGNTDLVHPTKPSPTVHPTKPSPWPTQKTKKTLSGLLVAVIGAGNLFVISIGAFVVLSIYKKDAEVQSDEHISQPQVAPGNILTPNNVHRSNIDDPRLLPPTNPIVAGNIVLVATMAFTCLHPEPRFRPSMLRVSQELISRRKALAAPLCTVSLWDLWNRKMDFVHQPNEQVTNAQV
ncbi:hypothetical protein RHSIM_RhsimUnG0063000 [Rhododendron simsii]|uniref:Leucine-rich repeat-containing N-terminal plant-type domain-containing protein n=1 Tax=Rhododendron simsii TaxID=118357 RepID=A0A834L4T6_RHOSS|nr:hypothetical protein RHSIM_RhsimUnG0063000 [Rhododendron simsii]